jgi:carbonic anhydrase
MEVKFDVTNSMNSSAYGMQLNGAFVPATQLHFHSPSEHTFNGVHYPLELHIVNQPVNMTTLAGGVPAAVIAILFEYTCVRQQCAALVAALRCPLHCTALL